MSRKTTRQPLPPQTLFPLGTQIVVRRPSVLWAGLTGVVLKHNADNTTRCLLERNGATFLADICGGYLGYDL